MCGLSGYIGLNIAAEDKLMLVLGLGDGIDSRGGHSCGYASVTFATNPDEADDIRYARKKGTWIRSRLRFVEGAAADICLMHARYATCGSREDPMNAHPFAIRRGGRVVMWGAHNGMVPDAFKSAKLNGRDINVDSQEIFELLADKNYDGIRDMAGYGVVTWIDTDHRDYVNLCRLSSHSDICVVSVKGGGVVWGSTWKIVREALKVADLEVEQEFKIDEIGRVYRIRADGVFKTKLGGIAVGYYNKYTKSRTDYSSSSTTSKPAAPADEEIDENALVETKTPGDSYSSSYTGSGAYSPYPSSWKKDDKGLASSAEDDDDLRKHYSCGWD